MENYRLEKEYKVSPELFSEAYGEFQKKFVYPKSRIYMIIFTVIAIALLCVGIFAMSGASTRQKYIVYIAIVAAFAFAAREWYNPKKLRRSLTESVKALGEPVYKIGVGDKFVDISTVSDDLSDLSDEEKEDIPEDIDPLPEKTRLAADESFQLMEYERFFMLMSGKEMFYILPKEGFSENELDTVRSLKK